MQTRLYVSCFVARRAGASHEFLQLLREPSRYMGNTWQLVTGGIDTDETAWQAALRELREETGLTPIEFFQVDVVNTFYLAASDSIMHSPMFCAIVAEGAMITLSHENTAFRWVTREAMPSHLMWPGERLAFAELCKEILDDGPAKAFLKLNC